MGFKDYGNYNQNWKTSPIKSRCVKFFLKGIKFDISKYFAEKCNLVSDLIWKGINNGSISLEELKNKLVFKNVLQKRFRTILDCQSSAWERCIICSVLERYGSYIARNNNKFPKRIIKFREEKAIRIYENILRDKGDYLQLSIPGKKKEYENINFIIPGTMNNYRNHVTKGMGGNLITKHNHFIARCKVPIKWKYEPKNSFGIDINKRSGVFIICSDATLFTHSDKLENLIDEMKKINKEISNKNKKETNLNSKQRKRRRIRLKKMHKQQAKLISFYVKEILDKAEKDESLVCIDNAVTGARNGSYGQDKLIKDLIREAENRCIPHVLVPPKNTSAMCSTCNSMCDRGTKDKIGETTCPICGKLDADLNGAKNVARFGWEIWNNGIKAFYPWRNALV